MREILVINPRKKKAKGRKGGNMARRKKTRRRKATPKRRYRRRNPSTPRRRRRSNPRGGRLLAGLSIQTALKDQIPIQIGVMAAKFAKKRFGPIADDYDPSTWNWGSYAKGALGALGGAMLINMIKPGWGQKVLTGGLTEVTSRLLRNEVINNSPFMIAQFGADEGGEGEGVYVDEDGTPYASNGLGEYLPLDEQHRMLPSGSVGYGDYGDSLVEPGPLGELEPVGPLGLGEGDFEQYARVYDR